MKHPIIKIILSIFAVATLASCNGNADTSIHGIANIEGDEWAYDQDSYSGDIVYVCTGGYSKKYHNTPDCRYLDNCKGEVREVDQQFAEEKGRTPCKACYK